MHAICRMQHCGRKCVLFKQGSEKVKKLRAVVATEAQKYVASMFEVHSEVGQLRDNLREQHRVWLDFYSTVFHVWHCLLIHCMLCDTSFCSCGKSFVSASTSQL